MLKAWSEQYQQVDDSLEVCLSAALQEFFVIVEERAGEGWTVRGRDLLGGDAPLEELLEK